MRAIRCGSWALLGVIGLAAAARGDERAVDWKDLPAAVRRAAEQAAAGVKWTGAVEQSDDDETTYRLKGKDAKGRAVEATFAFEVHVQLVETTLDVNALPEPLADAVKPMAGAKWTGAAEKTGEDDTTLEAVGTDAKGHEVTVSVASDGRAKVRTELELDELPPAVSEALKARLPDFRPHGVASVAEQGAVLYVFRGERADGEIEVSISPDGKTITIGGDDDDD